MSSPVLAQLAQDAGIIQDTAKTTYHDLYIKSLLALQQQVTSSIDAIDVSVDPPEVELATQRVEKKLDEIPTYDRPLPDILSHSERSFGFLQDCHISNQHVDKDGRTLFPVSRRRASEGDIALFAAQWLAELSSDSENESSSDITQPAMAFNPAIFRCHSTFECAAIDFGCIEEYQGHLIGHFDAAQTSTDKQKSTVRVCCSGVFAPMGDCEKCTKECAWFVTRPINHIQRSTQCRVRENFMRRGTVLLQNRPLKKGTRRSSLPVLIENLSIDDDHQH